MITLITLVIFTFPAILFLEMFYADKWWRCLFTIFPIFEFDLDNLSDNQQHNIYATYLIFYYSEAVVWRCSVEKVFLEISQNSQESTCVRVSFLIKLQALACNFIKKETLVLVFSCEFCEISKNPFFYKTHPVAASDYYFPRFVCSISFIHAQ